MITGLWELKKTSNSKHKSWKSSQLRVESESESEVTQLCPTLCDPMDCSPPGSSVHGILQARILEWVAISFSMQADFLPLQCLVALNCYLFIYFYKWRAMLLIEVTGTSFSVLGRSLFTPAFARNGGMEGLSGTLGLVMARPFGGWIGHGHIGCSEVGSFTPILVPK